MLALIVAGLRGGGWQGQASDLLRVEIGGGPVEAARTRLLASAMRPAGTPARPIDEDVAGEALASVCRIDCAGAREEATTIALLLREALEIEGKTAALITPDRGLARRVASELGRWDIEIDDSGGSALALTPVGAYLRLLARMCAERWAPVPLLSLLKHPLAGGAAEAGGFRARVRALERAVLRGPRPGPGPDGLLKALDASDAPPAVADFVRRVADSVAPLDALIGGREASTAPDLAAAHVASQVGTRNNAVGYAIPAVTALAPYTGPTSGGFSVTVSGASFGTYDSTPSVALGSSLCSSVSYVSDTSLACQAVVGMGGGLSVVVEVDGQRHTEAQVFSYYAPNVTAASPDHGPTAGGSSITILGSSFGQQQAGAPEPNVG